MGRKGCQQEWGWQGVCVGRRSWERCRAVQAHRLVERQRLHEDAARLQGQECRPCSESLALPRQGDEALSPGVP